jgi:hypothetical protein
MEKEKAPKNRTLTVSENERSILKKRLIFPDKKEMVVS